MPATEATTAEVRNVFGTRDQILLLLVEVVLGEGMAVAEEGAGAGDAMVLVLVVTRSQGLNRRRHQEDFQRTNQREIQYLEAKRGRIQTTTEPEQEQRCCGRDRIRGKRGRRKIWWNEK